MSRGFSLVELLMATAITAGVAAIVFQLWHQNERVFRDEALVTEMQQAARAAMGQIAEDIRIAGAGMPIYAANSDAGPAEATTAILSGTDSQRLQIRAGFSNIASRVSIVDPPDLQAGLTATVTVDNATVFSNHLGTTPAGRYVYLWGPTDNGWEWVRALVYSIAAASKTLRIVPFELSGVTVRFNAPPAISLEEAIALYLDPASGAIRRTTATSMTNALKPGWAPANELAANVSSLDFLYYDAQAQEVIPDTLNRRAGIDHIRVSLVVRTSAPLSNGSWPTYKMTTRVVPRNLRIR